ncbi:hypothetical protein Ancab_020958 [Ancistrocladus abbreviatus]
MTEWNPKSSTNRPANEERPPARSIHSRPEGAFRGLRTYKEVVASSKPMVTNIPVPKKEEQGHQHCEVIQADALQEDVTYLNDYFVGETYAIDQVPMLQKQFHF